MPMKICDMPSAFPVPSAALTRISLIQAASTDAPARRRPGGRMPQCFEASCALSASSLDARERAGMRLEQENSR